MPNQYISVMEMSKEQLVKEIENKAELFVGWFDRNEVTTKENGKENAWSAGQHLLHMCKSTKPLAVGLGYPRFLLRLKFGKTNRPSASYEGLVEKYKNALAKGGKAMGSFVPREVNEEEKLNLMERFNGDVSLLASNLKKWPEKSLDKLVIPHPLIGKLTVREMMYFTIYHTEHHFKILDERY